MNHVREANNVLLLQNGEEVLIRIKSKKEIQKKILEYKEKTGNTTDNIIN